MSQNIQWRDAGARTVHAYALPSRAEGPRAKPLIPLCGSPKGTTAVRDVVASYAAAPGLSDSWRACKACARALEATS